MKEVTQLRRLSEEYAESECPSNGCTDMADLLERAHHQIDYLLALLLERDAYTDCICPDPKAAHGDSNMCVYCDRTIINQTNNDKSNIT